MNRFGVFIILLITLFNSCNSIQETGIVHVFEVQDLIFYAEKSYANPYTEVECWVDLKGPDFSKRIYGFWNGENEFVVRVVAIAPGKWEWKSGSNQNDTGLTGIDGKFEAVSWTDEEIAKNPNRRGFLRPTENGHALEYADGSPFFMLGDTWWAASTWRFPLKGIIPHDGWVPNKDFSFEQALEFRKEQDYNTIAMIAAYPNWKVDEFPAQYYNEDSIGVRQAWKKNGMQTAKDMHADNGEMPFEAWDNSPVIANFDRVNPRYFQSLDKKIAYLNEQGFIAFLETVRRDHGPSWKKYFDWPESFSRYVEYIIARYGAYNIIFSGIHLDWITPDFSLSAKEFNEALTFHYKKYGELPYGQPSTVLIDGSTYKQFGHGEDVPWLNMHSVGNVPRNHGFYPMIEDLFYLDHPYPAANMEPYYPGWNNEYHNRVAGELPEPNSERDNYFGRTQMYGSVLSGGLAGYIYGTGAYCGNTFGEPRNEGERPYIWDALKYSSGKQLQYLKKFLLSEGSRYVQCVPSKEMLQPYKAKDAPEDGLDGWSFLLLSPEKDLGFVYFENQCEIASIKDLIRNRDYQVTWFNPISGDWLNSLNIKSSDAGVIELNAFPDGTKKSKSDWAVKIRIEH